MPAPTPPHVTFHRDKLTADGSLIREMLRLTPTERLRRADRAKKSALTLFEAGRRARAEAAAERTPSDTCDCRGARS
ncbi:MAG: hypothetical protein AAGI30_04065 [Planctomycetota bacterium]